MAVGADGEERILETGSEAKDSERIAVFNCAHYADGEKVSLRIRAWDKAGNESEITGTVVVVDRSARPLSVSVHITNPANGAQIEEKQISSAYEIESEVQEEESLLYIDGKYAGAVAEGVFPFAAIRYAENSVHSLGILSRMADGSVQYSEGLASVVWLSDTFTDGGYVSATESVTLGDGARLEAGAATGTLVSQTIALPLPLQSIRLSVTEDKQDGGEIIYFYSVDDGESWTAIVPETDVPLLSAAKTLILKAMLSGGGDSPVLYGWTLHGAMESSPLRVSVRLLRPVETITLSNTSVKQALTMLADAPEGATRLAQYVDGVNADDGFTYDARLDADGARHDVALFAVDAEGVLHGTGAKTGILLRENPDSTEDMQTEALTGAGTLYALRLEALYTGEISFLWSADGKSWKPLPESDYCLLDKAVEQVYLRAELQEGAVLQSWHLEGVSGTAKTVTSAILSRPKQVKATDWGSYYDDEHVSERRYELSWTDPTPADTSADNETEYEIYRNGKKIASTTATRYVDTEYVSGAQYEVRTVRGYGGGYATHVSDKSAASVTVIPAPESPAPPVDPEIPEDPVDEPESPETPGTPELPDGPETPKQPAPRSGPEEEDPETPDVYKGKYIFVDPETVPGTDDPGYLRRIGRDELCAYGLEPVNFNTGNFILETEDLTLADMGAASLSIQRTYNAQSPEGGGAFGAKWASPWTQRLRIKGDRIEYIAGDGAELVFTRASDGNYVGDAGAKESLRAEGDGYAVENTARETAIFDSKGTLEAIRYSDGGEISLARDGEGHITGFTLPSGETVKAESDKEGRITAIVTLGGSILKYEYEDGYLIRFTDAAGGVTRYEYDAQGQMTAWYDAAGHRQASNSYDGEFRVIGQIDANGGEYTIAYADDHTTITDADGNISEIWYDERCRTTKTVDANGAEISYEYDGNDNIVAITDALGNTTRYEYDAAGHKTKETAPDGSSYSLQYDAKGNLIRLTNWLGGVTRYEYDEHNRLVKQTNPDGGVQRWSYNESGQVETVTDPLGAVTAYEYAGVDLIKTTDALGNVTCYTYDAQHRLTETTDALGNKTAFAYDAADNLTSVTYADGTSYTYAYDAVGNLVAETDAAGTTTRYEYDALRQLVKVIYPDGNESEVSKEDQDDQSSYEYDLNGKLISLTLATGDEIKYTYDCRNRLISMETPGETTRYEYDAAGNVTLTAIGDVEKRCVYDSMNRPVYVLRSDGEVRRYRYDMAGNAVWTDDKEGATVNVFDLNGNLLSITDEATGKLRYRYEYDALNRIVAMYHSDGSMFLYGYNEVGEQVYREYVEPGQQPHGMNQNAHYKPIDPLQPDTEDLRYQSFYRNRNTLDTGIAYLREAQQSVKEAELSCENTKKSVPGTAMAEFAELALQQAKQSEAYAKAARNAILEAPDQASIQNALHRAELAAQDARIAAEDAMLWAEQAASIKRAKQIALAGQIAVNGMTAESPRVQSIAGEQGYGCGGESQAFDSFDRETLIAILVSSDETLIIAYIKELLESSAQSILRAKHTTSAARAAAQKTLQQAGALTAVSIGLDFATQLLFGESFASAGIKSGAHFLIGLGAVALVGAVGLTGGMAIAAALVITIGVNLLVDYVYNEEFKETVDEFLPYGIYG